MKKMLVFQTDFTYAEGAVPSMLGVVKSVDLDIECITATHQIPQYDTYSASFRLYQYIDFWPKGTIFVSVVDPGVGTARRACVAKTKNGYFIVTPDNGSLTHVYNKWGIEEVREIDETVNRLHRDDNGYVSIFHGRDVYAYTGARLASNTIDMEGVGPKLNVEDVVELELYGCKEIENGVKGQIDILDVRFGSLWTSIPYEEFKKCGFKFGDNVLVKIYNRDVCVYTNTINYGKSFADVPISTPIIYMNSSYHIAVAINQGSFAKAYNIGVGSDWKITMQKSI